MVIMDRSIFFYEMPYLINSYPKSIYVNPETCFRDPVMSFPSHGLQATRPKK